MNDGSYATSIRIEASPEAVFPYLTDADLVVRWMGEWCALQAEPGGEFAVDVTGVPVRGRYVEVEPPHRVVFTWGAAGNDTFPPGSSTVEITLRPDGDATVLDLIHRDLPPEEQRDHAIGWSHFLSRLVVAASGGDPGADPWAQAAGDTTE